MFGIDPLYLGLGVSVFLILEIGLFWAAASLGDAPVLGSGRMILVGLGIAMVWGAIVGVAGWHAGLSRATFSAENWTGAVPVLAISLAAMWAIPAILYAPLLPVSLAQSMKIACYQVFLRGFAYAFLAAVAMVPLAASQIWNRADIRSILLP